MQALLRQRIELQAQVVQLEGHVSGAAETRKGVESESASAEGGRASRRDGSRMSDGEREAARGSNLEFKYVTYLSAERKCPWHKIFFKVLRECSFGCRFSKRGHR